jgi:hypothetical protein
MVAQQNTKPVDGPPAHDFEGVPQTDLVRGQHGFSQIMLQLIDDAERTPVTTR